MSAEGKRWRIGYINDEHGKVECVNANDNKKTTSPESKVSNGEVVLNRLNTL